MWTGVECPSTNRVRVRVSRKLERAVKNLMKLFSAGSIDVVKEFSHFGNELLSCLNKQKRQVSATLLRMYFVTRQYVVTVLYCRLAKGFFSTLISLLSLSSMVHVVDQNIFREDLI